MRGGTGGQVIAVVLLTITLAPLIWVRDQIPASSVKVYRNIPMDVDFTGQIVVLVWSTEDYSFDPQSSYINI